MFMSEPAEPLYKSSSDESLSRSLSADPEKISEGGVPEGGSEAYISNFAI